MKKLYTLATLAASLFCCLSSSALSTVSIASINHQDATTGVADSLNKRFQITGTVYGGNLAASGKLTFFMNDGTGAIQVYASHTFGYAPTEGDSIIVVGSLTQYGGIADCGQLEIKPSATTNGDTVYKVGTGTLMAPEVVTTLDEAHESHLVRVNGLTLSYPADWTNSASGFTVRTTQNVKIYISKYTNATSVATPGATSFDVIGMESQYDTSAPYTQYYSMSPRYASDLIITATGINEVNTNALRAIAFPNPAADNITISYIAANSGEGQLTLTDISGRQLKNETLNISEGENRKEIALNALANGFYLVKLQQGDKTSVVKFCVSK